MQGFVASLAAILPLVAAAPLAPNTRDSNPGCQAAVQNGFEWTVEDFDFHASYIFTTPAHQNSWGFVSFNLSNPSLTYKSECTAESDQLEDFFFGNVPYTCTEPSGSTTVAKFDFSRPNNKLDINSTWICSDVDPQYPARFDASGTANLTLDCSDTLYQNPNWTEGEIYSDRSIVCGLVTVPVKPYQITAVA